MISKELLSEVLGEQVEIRGFKDMYIPANFEYIQDMIDVKAINIYELAHKCKEWALSKGYALVSYGKECFLYETEELYDVSEQLNEWSEWFEANTEVEAIFNACQWILKQNKEKNR